jgi:flagellar FliL protein
MAAQEKHEAKETPSAMSTKKLIIIITGVVAINLALVAGVVVYMGGHGASAGTAAHGKSGDLKAVPPPVIYPLEPFIVNIYDGPSVRYLKVKLEMGIPDAEAKAKVDPYLAPMRDAILTILSSKSLEDIKDSDGKKRLRDEILTTVQRIVPQGKVSQIYFTDFVTQ